MLKLGTRNKFDCNQTLENFLKITKIGFLNLFVSKFKISQTNGQILMLLLKKFRIKLSFDKNLKSS